MIKSLIIGSNGFIAHDLLNLLHNEGHTLFGCSRTVNKHPLLIPISHYQQLNIANKNKIHDFIHKHAPSYVFLLAASMNRDPAKLQESINTNVRGVLNVLESLKSLPETRLVYLCTGELYNGQVPYTEHSPLQPKSVYSLTKYQGTLLIEYFMQFQNLNATILRPSIIYGPGQTGNMFIPDAISNLLQGNVLSMTKGEQTRDFVYSEDMAKAMFLAATHPNAHGHLFNISSGTEVAIRDVAEIICQLTGKSLTHLEKSKPYRVGEQMRYCLDNNKAKAVLGWHPSITLEKGLKKTIEWYLHHVRQH